jgi:uncharacterized protein (UPF0332 family)
MNAEVLDLWERAKQAIKTAETLVTMDSDACASRAYYAAFYAVSAYFLLQGKSFSKHSALEAAVHRDLVKTGVWNSEIGADYSTLMGVRATGDYGGQVHVKKDDAKKALKAANRIIQDISEKSEIFKI